MKPNLVKIALIFLTVGILSACGSQPTEIPASAPTEASVPAAEASTNPPAEPASASQATEAPAANPGAQTNTVSFTNDIAPLLTNRCGSCHGGSRIQEGLNVTTYADLMKGSDNGPVIVPGDSGNSLLVDLVASQEMPKRGP